MEPTIELTPAVRKYTRIYTDATHVRAHNQLVANERLNIIDFTRDYDLNIVCGDICIEETLKCVATCEPTDSHCLSACFRSQNVCFQSKLL